jgi:nucleoid DNA-binding protein
MNKQHLIDAIATKTDISKTQASRVLETLLDAIKLVCGDIFKQMNHEPTTEAVVR